MSYDNSSEYIFNARRGNNYGGPPYDRDAMIVAFEQTAGGCPSCGLHGHSLPPASSEGLADAEVERIISDSMKTFDHEIIGLLAVHGPDSEE